MDVGTLLSAVQTLFASLQCSELRELCYILGYKQELKNLEQTVNTIKAVLLDAESQQVQVELSHQAFLWIQELKDVVYDADDLIDEFVTLAKQKKLIKGGNVSKKVRLLFSRFNSLAIARKMSQGIKEIRKRLDAIASNHNQFGFKVDCQPIRRRREETCSYVHAPDIIGRGDDVENIVARLLDPNVPRDVSCLAIVGIGGLGKTSLVQLVYNDPRIKENFPLRMWTCVADQDIKHLDVKATLCKILHAATGNNHEHLSMDHLQRQLQEQFAGKKYLLVLDDVWNEVRDQWLEMEKFLISGLRGCWIVVTTRSEGTAIAVGDEHPYKLKGLSQEDSWRLFMRTAFGERSEQANPDLVGIGQEIVKRCANVPLAIRVVGTLLYGQGKEKWLSLKEVGLGRVKQGEKGIKPILKLSYDHLESPLKTCFNYCALFPKDFEIEKEMLINLWIAQGFVVPLDEGQSIEDASGEYFSILLKRCFFQDVRKDEYGEIISCKIHDLMHDIAQEVAGKDIHAGVYISSSLNNEVRHLSYSHFAVDTKKSFIGLKIRTCLRIADIHTSPYQYRCKSDLCILLANWTCLRALDLSDLDIKNLPNAMGRLIHLRYLDLSYNPDLEVLPDSTTTLHNLETLRLVACRKLRELPKDLSKLTKLRVLDTSYCWGLAPMPRRMGRLICLQKLPLLVLGERTPYEGWGLGAQLEEIRALKNIKGDLFIQVRIPADARYVLKNGQQGGYLSEHQRLTKITFRFPSSNFDEALLEDLQPHPSLKDLKLEGYCGKKMPYWAREENLAIFLPNLVSFYLQSCHKLQHLAVLGRLPKLEFLRLEDLPDLEYIEDTTMSKHSGVVGAWKSEESFFPSLEELELWGLPKLKGWWGDGSNTNQRHGLLRPSFPHLSHLRIEYCPNLACVPLCPRIEVLTIVDCNANLQIVQTIESGNSRLRIVETDRAGRLKLMLPMEAFQHLNQMYIWSDKEVENLSDVEVFSSCSSSLRTLQIWNWYKLKSLCGELEHLTALEKLELRNLPNLSLNNAGEDKEDDGMPWHCLRHCLRSLELSELPKLVNLPNGMRYLTALQSLHIEACRELESMPEWMLELTSLKQLIILDCSDGLTERCHNCTGEDWPNIQHIPQVRIH